MLFKRFRPRPRFYTEAYVRDQMNMVATNALAVELGPHSYAWDPHPTNGGDYFGPGRIVVTYRRFPNGNIGAVPTTQASRRSKRGEQRTA